MSKISHGLIDIPNPVLTWFDFLKFLPSVSSFGKRKLSDGSEPAPKKQVKKPEVPKKKMKQQKLFSFFKKL